MKQGPSPKPTALRIIEGNPSKRPLNDAEPTPAPNRGKPRPAHTSPWMNDEAKKMWRRLVPELEKLQLYTVVDWVAMAMLCETYALYIDQVKEINRQGTTFVTETGYEGIRPCVSIARKALKDLESLLCEFGLTPASRSRIKVGLPSSSDFEELLD